ncbi:hypothetical protein ABMY26_06475 (plasmid) [Azospirillum sp. HJ39]|uniref:hypothetical protein n=1 Tax=Azospirillum sp. HJ39 TaxID=3159496 RepID=UPI003558D343
MKDVSMPCEGGTGELNPTDRLAAAVQRHVETDGAEPVPADREVAVLMAGVTDPRAVAAILYLAHDAIVAGEVEQAGRHILRVANALAGDDPQLAIIGRFYAAAS